ncbi:hypothetical protein SBY92_002425 [Candida maltosa Xu316]
MSGIVNSMDSLIEETVGLTDLISPIEKNAAKNPTSAESVKEPMMTTTIMSTQEQRSSSIGRSISESTTIEELHTAIDVLPILSTPSPVDHDTNSVCSDINTIHHITDTNSGPPLFERTVLQHHNIELKVPESKQSLSATTEIEESEPSAEVLVDCVNSKLSQYDISDGLKQRKNSSQSEEKVNPVSQALKKNQTFKKFKLNSLDQKLGNLDGVVPLIINSPVANEIKMPTTNLWVLQDYENLFGSKSFQREIDLAKSLRFIGEKDMSNHDDDGVELPDLSEEKVIYISTRIINPTKILSVYLSTFPRKRDLYIDLVMNNNGCNILLQLMKYIRENERNVYNLIDAVFVRISASYVHQIKVFLGMFTDMKKFYNKIKTLGLFIGVHQYENGYVLGAPQEDIIKFPPKLEKLYLANGLKLTDFSTLPLSVKNIGLHNSQMVTFSKFNLSKQLNSLHISGEKLQLNGGKLDSFPIGFLALKEIKFDASIVVNFNFEKFVNLTSLGLSNLQVIQTRQLEFPISLKKLEFIDCSISSHISPFPILYESRWSIKRNANLSRLQYLKMVDVQVKDLTDKVNACFGLLKLEITNSSFNNIENLKLPTKLSFLKLIDVNINGFRFNGFPSTLESVELENNGISSIVAKNKLKTLRVAKSKLKAEIDLSAYPIQDVNLEGSEFLESLTLHKKTVILTASNTSIQKIIGHGLTRLILNGCNKIDWNIFKLPPFVTQLSLQHCGMDHFEPQEVNNHVRSLDLSKNKLKKINLSKYENLQDIELSHNHLKNLSYENFPPSLKSINAKKNGMEEAKLGELYNLEWLQLSDNKFTGIGKIHLPPNINALMLNNNNFGEIDNVNFHIPKKLRHLELNRCKITKFELTLNSQLMSCCLNGNKLHGKGFHITFNQLPSSLKFLDLSSNFFKSFDFDMVNGVELAEINLANNMFDEIPDLIPDNILSAIIFKVE